jgi:hypothetical protein
MRAGITSTVVSSGKAVEEWPALPPSVVDELAAVLKTHPLATALHSDLAWAFAMYQSGLGAVSPAEQRRAKERRAALRKALLGAELFKKRLVAYNALSSGRRSRKDPLLVAIDTWAEQERENRSPGSKGRDALDGRRLELGSNVVAALDRARLLPAKVRRSDRLSDVLRVILGAADRVEGKRARPRDDLFRFAQKAFEGYHYRPPKE